MTITIIRRILDDTMRDRISKNVNYHLHITKCTRPLITRLIITDIIATKCVNAIIDNMCEQHLVEDIYDYLSRHKDYVYIASKHDNRLLFDIPKYEIEQIISRIINDA